MIFFLKQYEFGQFTVNTTMNFWCVCFFCFFSSWHMCEELKMFIVLNKYGFQLHQLFILNLRFFCVAYFLFCLFLNWKFKFSICCYLLSSGGADDAGQLCTGLQSSHRLDPTSGEAGEHGCPEQVILRCSSLSQWHHSEKHVTHKSVCHQDLFVIYSFTK